MSNYEIDGALVRGTECVSTNDIHINDAETICKNKMCGQNPSVLVLNHSIKLPRNERHIKQFYDDNILLNDTLFRYIGTSEIHLIIRTLRPFGSLGVHEYVLRSSVDVFHKVRVSVSIFQSGVTRPS